MLRTLIATSSRLTTTSLTNMVRQGSTGLRGVSIINNHLDDVYSSQARYFSEEGNSSSSSGTPEEKMQAVLRDELGAEFVEIEDISGGCGSMYKMFVVSAEFEGLNQVKQHRLVQRALASEIADMHGLTLKTLAASKFKDE